MPQPQEHYQELIKQLDQLHQDAVALEEKFSPAVEAVHPRFRKSAKNLLHYLALRQHDIRELQEQLAHLGLSSLGRAEGHVLASLQAVRQHLCHMAECTTVPRKLAVSFFENHELLATHTEALLGPKPRKRTTRIMVTLPSEAADQYELLPRLLKAGMDCARINCAHDTEREWLKMVENIHRAEKETGIPCKILMDLMGPKLRTGPLKEGPKLLVIHPVQDNLGQITEAAKVWLAPQEVQPPKDADAWLPVEATWLAQLQEGDKLYFTDTRGRKRSLTIIRREEKGLLAHLLKTSYIKTGTELRLKGKNAMDKATRVGDLKALELPITLKKDSFLVLTREPTPGEPATYDAHGHVAQPAHISCTLPEAFTQTEVGQPILFNDGKIEGILQEVTPERLLVKITYASDKGSRLRADQGINLPESKIHINGLTKKDRQDLKFVAKHADVVNLSFVNHADTVDALHKELRNLKAKNLGVMLKIETKEGFRNLPHLLLTAMKSYPASIMIARGDLAVECGWQRLAEVQEEILWLCEAAHIPVVWATQVLETLAKKGRPSRAEITDAAMAQRADCVMLNKGPHVVQAIEMLHDILVRMQEHQHKKTSMLRSLHISELNNLIRR
ncbi:pyruvate kinase [Pontibacter anaerobius]|uniref:pyruvate kinase n=1 Tax=Pontibacter anaerobius TaxID=2993940 RepID=A0ABT3RDW4_9BACT|nr:pyruvate kinase [Pontibacter anaerobius]MCX2739567.1 pyruvate kinase [Pontibacter anaerobius]